MCLLSMHIESLSTLSQCSKINTGELGTVHQRARGNVTYPAADKGVNRSMRLRKFTRACLKSTGGGKKMNAIMRKVMIFIIKCDDVCWLEVNQACSGCHCFMFMEDPSCIRAKDNSLFRCYALQREHIISYSLLMSSCWLEKKVRAWIHSFYGATEQKCSDDWASVTKVRHLFLLLSFKTKKKQVYLFFLMS